MSTVESVLLGQLMPGVQPFRNKNLNSTFIGVVHTDAVGPVRVFIKDIGAKEIGNELLSAVLGRAIGLPIPRPILAIDGTGIIAATKAPVIKSGERLYFASERQGTPPLAQLCLAGADVSAVIEHLGNWAALGRAYGFDTWVANVDRHANNILFDGAKSIWLIDHGRSFGGEAWTPESLVPLAQFKNLLAEWLIPLLSSQQKAALIRKVTELASACKGMDVSSVIKASLVEYLLSAPDCLALEKFLTERSDHLIPIAAASSGMPRLL